MKRRLKWLTAGAISLTLWIWLARLARRLAEDEELAELEEEHAPARL